MSQNVGIIGRIQHNNGFDIGGHLLFASDLLHQQNGALAVDLMHDVSQNWHPLNMPSASKTAALTNNEPVAKISAGSHMWINSLENHGQTEEQSASQHLLRKERHRKLIGFEVCSHHLGLRLHDILIEIGNLSECLLDPVNHTFDLSGVVFEHALRQLLHEHLPVVSAVPELDPLVGEAEVVQDD